MVTNEDGDKRRLRWQQMLTTPMMVLQSGLCPRALQRWRAEEKKEIFFLLLHVLFLLLFSSSSSFSKITTRVTHYMIAS
jgi:hypothetical protein